jgi:hypothetical protein
MNKRYLNKLTKIKNEYYSECLEVLKQSELRNVSNKLRFNK